MVFKKSTYLPDKLIDTPWWHRRKNVARKRGRRAMDNWIGRRWRLRLLRDASEATIRSDSIPQDMLGRDRIWTIVSDISSDRLDRHVCSLHVWTRTPPHGRATRLGALPRWRKKKEGAGGIGLHDFAARRWAHACCLSLRHATPSSRLR